MNDKTSAHVGIDGWKTLEVRFRGLTSEWMSVSTPEFTCFGRSWALVADDHGPAFGSSFFLQLRSGGGVIIDIRLSVKRSAEMSTVAHYSHDFGSRRTGGIFITDLFNRDLDLLKAVLSGARTVKVHMRLNQKTTTSPVISSPSPPLPFIPKNPFRKLMLNKFMDKASADVVFEVGGDRVGVPPAIFHAHHFVLEACAPMLAHLGGSGEGVAPIPIADVKPGVFKHLLYYAYGGKVSEEDLRANAEAIMNAADKYEVVNLKLEAEAIFVTSTTITVDNVKELLLYGNDKNCALLKEAAIDFIAKNGRDILRRVSLTDIPAGLFADLLTAMTSSEEPRNVASEHTSDRFITMRVSELREKLYEKGMDIDGSREAMIASLKENP